MRRACAAVSLALLVACQNDAHDGDGQRTSAVAKPSTSASGSVSAPLPAEPPPPADAVKVAAVTAVGGDVLWLLDERGALWETDLGKQTGSRLGSMEELEPRTNRERRWHLCELAALAHDGPAHSWWRPCGTRSQNGRVVTKKLEIMLDGARTAVMHRPPLARPSRTSGVWWTRDEQHIAHLLREDRPGYENLDPPVETLVLYSPSTGRSAHTVTWTLPTPGAGHHRTYHLGTFDDVAVVSSNAGTHLLRYTDAAVARHFCQQEQDGQAHWFWTDYRGIHPGLDRFAVMNARRWGVVRLDENRCELLDHDGVRHVALAADGESIAMASEDGSLTLASVSDLGMRQRFGGLPLRRQRRPTPRQPLLFTSSGRYVAMAVPSGLTVVDTARRKAFHVYLTGGGLAVRKPRPPRSEERGAPRRIGVGPFERLPPP